MKLTEQIARQFMDVHFGGNWTASNLKDNLAVISWQQSIAKRYSFNTIAALVYHMNYYVNALLRVLEGKLLDASDKFSFEHPPILNSGDWERLLNKTWADAENLGRLVEKMPESKLWEDFPEGKYGNYYRNICGVIEHVHYHLGQIVLIKKILIQEKE
jgi:hypothetical protein